MTAADGILVAFTIGAIVLVLAVRKRPSPPLGLKWAPLALRGLAVVFAFAAIAILGGALLALLSPTAIHLSLLGPAHHWSLAAVGLELAAASGYVALRLVHAARPAISPAAVLAAKVDDPPHKAALLALAKLDAPDAPLGRERGLALATIARRFLTDVHGIRAASSTTAELLEQVSARGLPPEWGGVIQAIEKTRFGGPAALQDLEDKLRALLART